MAKKYEPKYDEAGNLVLYFDDGTQKIASKSRKQKRLIKSYKPSNSQKDFLPVAAKYLRDKLRGTESLRSDAANEELGFLHAVMKAARGGTALYPAYHHVTKTTSDVDDIHIPGKRLPKDYGHPGLAFDHEEYLADKDRLDKAVADNNIAPGVSTAGIPWVAPFDKEWKRNAYRNSIENLGGPSRMWEGQSKEPRWARMVYPVGKVSGKGDDDAEHVAPEFKPERPTSRSQDDRKKVADDIVAELMALPKDKLNDEPSAYRILRKAGISPRLIEKKNWELQSAMGRSYSKRWGDYLWSAVMSILEEKDLDAMVDKDVNARPSRQGSDRRIKFVRGKTSD